MMSDLMIVPLKKLPHGADLPLPAYGTIDSAGLDLIAAVETKTLLEPGQRLLIPTGIQIAIPQGFEGQIRPRSGLAFKHGVTVLNAPGTIDADYRGEVKVLLMNHGHEPFQIDRGMRIAQLVIAPYAKIQWAETSSDDLENTHRGEKGFGSTGLQAVA